MKIPESVRIGGVEFAVAYEKNLRDTNTLLYGQINYDTSTISLSASDGYEHQRQCITLWHEILHGIQQHSGIEIKNEEEVIEMLSKGIYQVLQDNAGRFFDLVSESNAT